MLSLNRRQGVGMVGRGEDSDLRAVAAVTSFRLSSVAAMTPTMREAVIIDINRLYTPLCGRYDRPVSPQRETDVSSNAVAALPSGEASYPSSSRSVFGRRPLAPSKRSISLWAFIVSSLSLTTYLLLVRPPSKSIRMRNRRDVDHCQRDLRT